MSKFEKILMTIVVITVMPFMYWLVHSTLIEQRETDMSYIDKGYTKHKVCYQYRYEWLKGIE